MKQYSPLGIICCLLVIFLLIPVAGWAQSFNATISGNVTDPSGALVPDVELTLTLVGTGAAAKTKTGPDGLFSFPNLQSGEYELKASAKGFRDFVQKGITVLSNQVSRIPITLELGAETQTVEVTADVSALNFENAEVKGAISPQTIQELPLLVSGITRSAVAFVKLMPGVVEAGGPEGNQFNVHINGGLTEGDEAVLDGVSASDGALGQQGILLQITGHPWSPEAVSEISILTSNYESQYGATTSSVTTAVTKSGTNTFHGSLYEYHRNTVLNARQFGIAERPKDIENDYGGTIGGPVKIPWLAWTNRRKTYAFFNYEGYTKRGAVSAPTYSIPSLKERAGDFTDWRDAQGNLIPIYDPDTTKKDPVTGQFTRQQFMGCDGHTPNVICPSDPRLQASPAQGWFKYLPQPFNDRANNNYRPPVPLTSTVIGDSKVLDLRVDHLVGDKDRFFFTWHYFPSKSNPNETVLPKEISSGGYRDPNTNTLARGSWDHTFNPNLINNLNLGYNNITSNTVCVDKDFAGATPAIAGVPNNKDYPAVIGLQDFEGMGCNGGFNQDRPSFIGNDLLSWVKGKHTLKFGAEYRNQQVNNEDFGNESGTFSFSRLSTGLPGIISGNSVASFLLGTVSSANVTLRTAGAQYARQPYLALYAGDTWKVTPKLSINYGVRWDFAYPVREKHDVLSFFDPKGANPAADGRPGRLTFAGDRWGPASYGKRFPESMYYKAIAPRFGFAYSVDNKTVVRAGYGVFFNQLYYTNWSAGIGGGLDGFNSSPSFSSTDGGITPAFLLQKGLPTIPASQIPPFIASTFRTGQSIGLYRGLEGGRPPYAQQWNLTIERQLTKTSYFTVAYVANKGTRLISDVARVNAINPSFLSMGNQLYDTFAPGQAVLDGVPAPYPGWAEQMTGCAPSVAQALLPYPQYCNSFSSINENAGSSTFHSFQAKFEKRFSEGFWLLGSYTLSKFLNNTDDVQRIDAGAAASFSPFERQRYKSLSTGDTPNALTVSLQYELPFGRGKRFLGSSSGVANAIIGGWQVTSIFTGSSGIPYIIRSSQCNVPSQFQAGCVPTVLSGANPFAQEQGGSFDPNKPLLNASAFESPNSFNFYTGQGSRTSNVRGFPYYGHDLAFIKNTRISERITFQFRGEFFNTWNWHRFVYGGTWGTGRAFVEDVASPNFGLWTGNVSKPRNIQLGAKIIF
jgi:Carboxypeptidase regulatory-like domain